MEITDVLFAFQEAQIEKDKEIEMIKKAISTLQQEFAFLMANQGRIQYTVKEIAVIYDEHPNTTKARIKKHGIIAVGKRGRSFTYAIADLECITLFRDAKNTSSPNSSRKDYFRKYRKAS
jgi:hypothetical protein